MNVQAPCSVQEEHYFHYNILMLKDWNSPENLAPRQFYILKY